MKTKYDIGDIVIVNNYYNERFASDVIEINIRSKENIYYVLSKTDSNGNNIMVGETIPDTADENRYYSIIKRCGNIKD